MSTLKKYCGKNGLDENRMLSMVIGGNGGGFFRRWWVCRVTSLHMVIRMLS